jgi:hypothetical protein
MNKCDDIACGGTDAAIPEGAAVTAQVSPGAASEGAAVTAQVSPGAASDSSGPGQCP